MRFVPVDVSGGPRAPIVDGGILARDGDVTYRRSGDDNLLVEFGPMQLDLALRMRVHALMESVAARGPEGITDLTPGIRSLQIQADPRRLAQHELLAAVRGDHRVPPPERRTRRPLPHGPPPPLLGRPRRPARRSPATTRARDIPAHQLFADTDRLAVLRGRALAALADADALLLPTAPGHPTLAEVAADPLGSNARLGRFTNSTNLFDLAAVAVPAGEVNGLPFGVMLIGPAFTDERLATIARLLQPETQLAVVGAHLSGQPLNPQLLALGARLDRTTTTAPVYRLHALRTTPPKPGLVHVGEGGAAIETEIWRLPAQGLGHLLAALPRPMALGSVELADSTRVPGFLCEPGALATAEDITRYGGWRSYLTHRVEQRR
ncbi:hypothetical protein SALBM311S_12758 [Streptomyces alboniger]